MQLASVGVRDLADRKVTQANQQKKKVNTFITDLMKRDRAQYEKLVDLMRYFNLIDVDLKVVSQLKA